MPSIEFKNSVEKINLKDKLDFSDDLDTELLAVKERLSKDGYVEITGYDPQVISLYHTRCFISDHTFLRLLNGRIGASSFNGRLFQLRERGFKVEEKRINGFEYYIKATR